MFAEIARLIVNVVIWSIRGGISGNRFGANTDTMQPDGPPWNFLNGTDPYRQAWSPDGNLLAFTTSITSNEHSVPDPVLIFKPGAVDWKTALCAIAGTDLTDAEWKANTDTSLVKPHLCS